MLINTTSGNNISSRNNKDSQILDLNNLIRIKNEEKRKIIILNKLRKTEKYDFRKYKYSIYPFILFLEKISIKFK